MEILNEFCSHSGQRVNFQKSKMFISPNVPQREATNLSRICGMVTTKDLGTYLGVPLIHGRVRKNHFNHIINKMQRKLSGWKASVLSLAGRATLVQAVTSSIPTYTMQTMKFPMSVCKHIDKINSNFLWGKNGDKNKIHLVKWRMVCKPKKFGGLGLRDCETNNKANLTKLGWRVLKEKDPLWVNILKSKYRIPPNPRNWKKNKSGSHIWRGIRDSKDHLVESIKWTVGNGTTISVWEDWWCGNLSFKSKFGDIGSVDYNIKVDCFINNMGEWDVAKINNEMPHECVGDFLSTPLSISNVSEKRDAPSWGLNGNGRFTVGSCYMQLLERKNVINNTEPNWAWIWKLKLPAKIIHFIWLVKLDRIICNEMCVRRGIT